MKIIHIHPSAAMAYKFVFPLMEEENLLGHDTKLIVFKNNSKKMPNIHFDLSINNLGLLIEVAKFIFFIKKHKPDVVFCHNSIQATIPLLFSKILKCKKIIYFNHGITFLGYSGFLKILFYCFEYLNSILSDFTITVSKDMKKHLDLIKPNTHIIHNGSACGINIDKNYKQTKVNKNKKVIITFVGRLEIRKGIKVLKKILDFFESYKNIKFIFCGFTNEQFEKIIKKKYENLQCLGFIDTVDEVLFSSDIFILPSLHEGLPYGILEAMLLNNIIIANNVDGINEIIINDFNGILIENNDPKKYINAINNYIDNKIDYKKFIRNGSKTIKKYDRIKFLKKYRTFITNLT